MLTSAECLQRAVRKIAEAECHPRGEKKLRADAECWMVLADRVERLESSMEGSQAALSKNALSHRSASAFPDLSAAGSWQHFWSVLHRSVHPISRQQAQI
jgi:hypothetical protein